MWNRFGLLQHDLSDEGSLRTTLTSMTDPTCSIGMQQFSKHKSQQTCALALQFPGGGWFLHAKTTNRRCLCLIKHPPVDKICSLSRAWDTHGNPSSRAWVRWNLKHGLTLKTMALLSDFREKHGIINLVNHVRVALEDLNQQDLYWIGSQPTITNTVPSITILEEDEHPFTSYMDVHWWGFNSQPIYSTHYFIHGGMTIHHLSHLDTANCNDFTSRRHWKYV